MWLCECVAIFAHWSSFANFIIICIDSVISGQSIRNYLYLSSGQMRQKKVHSRWIWLARPKNACRSRIALSTERQRRGQPELGTISDFWRWQNALIRIATCTQRSKSYHRTIHIALPCRVLLLRAVLHPLTLPYSHKRPLCAPTNPVTPSP